MPEGKESVEEPRSPRRILIVEDEESIRQLVVQTLQEEGYETVDAPHGAAALDLLNSITPDLILLDLNMPVMDGWEFAASYRERPGPHVPIVVITAGFRLPGEAVRTGAAGFLAKPFDLDELIETVAKHIGGGD